MLGFIFLGRAEFTKGIHYCILLLKDVSNLGSQSNAVFTAEEPEAFKKTIEAGVTGRQGRALKCSLVTGSFDWKTYLDLGVQLMGHTQTHENYLQNLDAVHYFELQLRRDLPAERKTLVKELLPIHLRGDSDVVLSVKKQLSDKEFSQCPMVFVPGQWLKELSPHGPGFTNPVPVSQATKKELLKTADKVEAAPWHMNHASAYLRRLAAEDFSTTPSCKPLPSIKEWQDVHSAEHTDLLGESDLAFANREAAQVRVKATRPTAAKSKPVAPMAPAPTAPCPVGTASEAHETSPLSGPPSIGPPSPMASPPSPPPAVAAELPSSPVPGLPSDAGSGHDVGMVHATPKGPPLKRPSASLPSVPAKVKARTGGVSKPSTKKVQDHAKPKAKVKASESTVILRPGEEVGCSKCRNNKKVGCAECRKKKGLAYNWETGLWSHP